MSGIEKLKRFIDDMQVDCTHLSFDQPTHSVEEAAEATGAQAEDFVKNICLLTSDSRLIVAIVKGEDRVSTKRVAKALQIERPVIAKPEEVLDRTGYAIGGVPSFGFEAVFLIDERVMEMEEIYSGGGSDHALVKITPEELMRSNRGSIVRVRK